MTSGSRPTGVDRPGPATTLREAPLTGDLPRFEIPGWQERFGVRAGVTGRGPGAAGFDLGLWSNRPVGEVMTRWRQLRRAEPGFHATILANQVHGTEVAWHRDSYGWNMLEGFDGHATTSPGLLLTVTIADCVPVYLVDPDTRVIALLHAGWRGTAGRILARGIEAMMAHGAILEHIRMHAGVGICGPCYEVGRDVMEGCGVAADGPGPWHLDLRDVLAGQARALGVASVTVSEWCSSHDAAHFFSHRRSRGNDGRMVAYLGILP